jgi:hypothetical protein
MADGTPGPETDRGIGSDAQILAFPGGGHRERSTGSAPDDVPDPEARLRDVIGEVLRDERRRQERTLADVAGQAAVSLPYLSEIERGTTEVSSDLLHAVVRSLDLDLATVLERAASRLRVGSQRRGPTLLAA